MSSICLLVAVPAKNDYNRRSDSIVLLPMLVCSLCFRLAVNPAQASTQHGIADLIGASW